jgi:AcrR family transcriptional regulator
VAAAAGLFLRQGYAATGVNEIMQRAGVTAGSFYHFFATKEELLLAVVDRLGGELEAELEAAAAGGGEPLGRLLAAVAAARSRRAAEAPGSPLGVLAAELSVSHPEVRARIAAVYAAWIERASGLLAAGGAQLPAELDLRALARFILAALEGGLLLARLEAGAGAIDDVAAGIERHLELLAAGGGRRRSPEPQRAAAERRPAPTADWRAW